MCIRDSINTMSRCCPNSNLIDIVSAESVGSAQDMICIENGHLARTCTSKFKERNLGADALYRSHVTVNGTLITVETQHEETLELSINSNKYCVSFTYEIKSWKYETNFHFD